MIIVKVGFSCVRTINKLAVSFDSRHKLAVFVENSKPKKLWIFLIVQKMNPVSCSLCMDPETSENPIIVCVGCDLKVHVLCYGIESFNENWMCSPCAEGAEQAVCKLCVQDGGALKKTTCGGWAHVLCALFIEGCSFLDNNLMEPVDISNVTDSKRNKTCMFCQTDRGFAPSCQRSKCKNRLHISCANKNGCLKEEEDKVSKRIKFRAYCLNHKPTDSDRRISAEFVRGAVMKKHKQRAKKSEKVKESARENSEKEKSSTMNIQWLMQKSLNANESSLNSKRKRENEPSTSDGDDHSKQRKTNSHNSLSSLNWDSYDLKNYKQNSTKSLSLGSIFGEANGGNEENVYPHACDKDEKINKVSVNKFSVINKSCTNTQNSAHDIVSH